MAANWRENFELVEHVRRVNNIRNRRQPFYRRRIDPFLVLNDEEFVQRYRLSKNTTRHVISMLREELEAQSLNPQNISVETMVLVTLRFFSKGCYQIENSDLHGLSQSSASKIVARVARALARRCREFINMPEEDADEIKAQFFNVAGFPNCIGCVDCTHIRIKNPDGQQPLLYCNRKGWYSLNVQVICDAKCRIRDIVARWRGSAHDARIWDESLVKEEMETGRIRGIILGDGGYPCRRYLLTPLLNPATPSEEAYNLSHIRTRNTIERLFGQWKSTFRALQNGMQIKLSTAKHAIVAMAILHNIKLQRDHDDIMYDEAPDIQPRVEINENNNIQLLNDDGNLFRRNFITRFFQR